MPPPWRIGDCNEYASLHEKIWNAYPELDPDGEGYGTQFAINLLFGKIIQENSMRVDYTTFVAYMRGLLFRYNKAFINTDTMIQAVRIITPPQKFSNILIFNYKSGEHGLVFTATTIQSLWVYHLLSPVYRDKTTKFMMVWEDMLLLPSLHPIEEDLDKLIQCIYHSHENLDILCDAAQINEMEIYQAFLTNFDIWSIFDEEYFKNIAYALWDDDVAPYQQLHFLKNMTLRATKKMKQVCHKLFIETNAVENFLRFLVNCKCPTLTKRSMFQLYAAQQEIFLTLPNPDIVSSHVIVWKINKLKPCILDVEKLFPNQPTCQDLYMRWYIKNILTFSGDAYRLIGNTYFPYFILGEYLITPNDERVHRNNALGFEHLLHITYDMNGEKMVYSPFFELDYIMTLSQFKIYGCYMTGVDVTSQEFKIIKGLDGYGLPVEEIASQVISIQMSEDMDDEEKYSRTNHIVQEWYQLAPHQPLRNLIFTYDTVTLPTFISSELQELIKDPTLYKKYYDRIGYLFQSLWTYIDCKSSYLYTYARVRSMLSGDDDPLFNVI